MRRQIDLTMQYQSSFTFHERTKRVRHDHSKFRRTADGEYDFDATYCHACSEDRRQRRNAVAPWRASGYFKPTAAEYRARYLPDVPDMNVARFLAGPINVERLQARDQCRLSDKKLEIKAAKFLTLASEYAARKRPNPLHEPLPTYADWLVRVCHLSRKDAERLAAKQNAECRAIAAAERAKQSADVIALPAPIETPTYKEAA